MSNALRYFADALRVLAVFAFVIASTVPSFASHPMSAKMMDHGVSSALDNDDHAGMPQADASSHEEIATSSCGGSDINGQTGEDSNNNSDCCASACFAVALPVNHVVGFHAPSASIGQTTYVSFSATSIFENFRPPRS